MKKFKGAPLINYKFLITYGIDTTIVDILKEYLLYLHLLELLVNFFVDSCFFNTFTSQVIQITSSSDTTKFLGYLTSFYNISSSTDGSSISFKNTGSSVLYKICGIKSVATDQTNFARIEVSQLSSNLNYLEMCTLSDCRVIDQGNDIVDLYYGNFLEKNTNLSKSNTRFDTSLELHSNPTSAISFCTFAENTAKQQQTFVLQNSYDIFISKCNIIKQNIISSLYGIFYLYENAKATISDCIFKDNLVSTIAYVSSGCSLVLNSCYIDSSSISFSVDGSLNKSNMKTQSFNNFIDHLVFDRCQAEYLFVARTNILGIYIHYIEIMLVNIFNIIS